MRMASPSRARGAFTLLEVMIAIGVFFLASFAILALVSSSLANARRLQKPMVDAGVLAAQFATTNALVEVSESGNLSELLGKDYAGYTWTRDITEVMSNKLFQVDFTVKRTDRDHAVVSQLSVLMFRPASPQGTLEGGMPHR